MEIYLASKSPRRKELLERMGLEFTVRAVNTNETMDPFRHPSDEVARVSLEKAKAVQPHCMPDDIIISADTIVVCDSLVMGKPHSESEAFSMLRRLSGRTHEVITAVSVWMVAAPNAEDVSLGFRTFADISHVTFRDLTDEEITDYLRKGESFDKAGAYAIQGEGAALVDHYDGALDTIIGLPATRLIKEFPDLVNAEAAEC